MGEASSRRSVKRLSILGKPWRVYPKPVAGLGDGDVGQCFNESLEIYADGRLCEDQWQSTVTHEVIEAINMELELGLTHTQICGIEIGLHSAGVRW